MADEGEYDRGAESADRLFDDARPGELERGATRRKARELRGSRARDRCLFSFDFLGLLDGHAVTITP